VAAELDALRTSLREGLTTGKPVVCPCCGRSARRYRRAIHATMAKFLCDLVRTTFETEREWISVGNAQRM
jgi:hypothetical protein